MTEAVKPPIVPAKTPIEEGVQARLHHLREVIAAYSNDLRELERLEKALIAATDRLDRHSLLMVTETQLLEHLLKRDARRDLDHKAQLLAQPKPGSVVPFVDHVEEALAVLTSGVKAS